MFLGILIGLAIFGIALVSNNPDRGERDPVRNARSYMRILGTACMHIGTCGAIGWIVEVLVT